MAHPPDSRRCPTYEMAKPRDFPGNRQPTAKRTLNCTSRFLTTKSTAIQRQLKDLTGRCQMFGILSILSTGAFNPRTGPLARRARAGGRQNTGLRPTATITMHFFLKSPNSAVEIRSFSPFVHSQLPTTCDVPHLRVFALLLTNPRKATEKFLPVLRSVQNNPIKLYAHFRILQRIAVWHSAYIHTYSLVHNIQS